MVIDTGGRKLYYVLPDKKAYAYPISVGREGFDWTGTETISRKHPGLIGIHRLKCAHVTAALLRR
jgi:lipoprotein-anchoring transpeptidase ErfK/SrfK